MSNNIIVYGTTRKIAFDMLEKLLNDMKYGDVADVRKNNYEFTAILKNGDRYKAMCASDSARGHKWQYAYIDKMISSEVLNNIIFPTFVPRLISGEYDENAKREDRIVWY